MKKRKSLIKRVKDAERRERDAKRRMMDMQQRLINADLIAQGSMIWVSALARKLGPVVHISAKEVEKWKMVAYKCRKVENGSVDMIEEGYFEKFNKD